MGSQPEKERNYPDENWLRTFDNPFISRLLNFKIINYFVEIEGNKTSLFFGFQRLFDLWEITFKAVANLVHDIITKLCWRSEITGLKGMMCALRAHGENKSSM